MEVHPPGEKNKRDEHVGMQKGAYFTIVSTKLLIG